jgi:amino acid adenylation domain-containing protein
MTVHDLLARNLEIRAEHPALVDGDDVIPYRDLADRVTRLASWLREAGVEPGDRVAILLHKCVEEIVAVFAAARAGAVFAPLHGAFKAPQIDLVLRDLDAAVLVTDARRAREILGRETPPGPRHVVITDGSLEHPRVTPWEAAASPDAAPPAPVRPDDLAAIFYTSGSTGPPKGVMHPHRVVTGSARMLAESVDNRPEDRLLGHLPLSASFGLVQVVTAFEVGATHVLSRRPFLGEILRALAEHRITGFGNITHAWTELVRHLVANPVDLPHLRYVTIAGSVLPPDVLEALPRVLPRTAIHQTYGLTEAYRVLALPPDLFPEKRGALGMPLPGVEVFVVDPDRGLVPPGEPGELIVRSPLATTGYWNAPEATDELLRPCPRLPGDDRVLHTGDVVREDGDGCLWFVGRRDALFKVAGYRVSPEEIEQALTSSGLVEHAVAFGVEDERRGTVVHAAVFPGDGRSVDEDALLAHCRDALPAHLVPVRVHVWRGEMPTVGPGKPDRTRIAAALGGGRPDPRLGPPGDATLSP